MTIRSSVLTWLLVGAVSGAYAEGQLTPQQRCLTRLNTAGATVADAIAEDIARCVRAAGNATLPAGQTAQQCLTADAKGRVARATAVAVSVGTRSCRTAPDFGGSSAATVNAAIRAMPRASYAFGDDLDAAIVRKSADAESAGCQQTVAKGLAKLVHARFTAFNVCTKTGLAHGVIQSAAGLVDCYQRISVARIVTAIGRTVANRCAGVTLASAFPGRCAGTLATTLTSCLEPQVDCAVCRALDGANTLGIDCTHYADGAGAGTIHASGGAANGSFPGGGGGGRIAVAAPDATGFTGTIAANGGTGVAAGAAGTIVGP